MPEEIDAAAPRRVPSRSELRREVALWLIVALLVVMIFELAGLGRVITGR